MFVGPSAGYLVGWVLGAFVVGWLTARLLPRYRVLPALAATALGGIVVVYLVGVPVLAANMDLPLGAAIAGSAIFLPGDILGSSSRCSSRRASIAPGRGSPRRPPGRGVAEATHPSMSEWLRGTADRVALAFGGDAVRYGGFARAVDAAVLPAGSGPVGCRIGTDPVDLVVAVLAPGATARSSSGSTGRRPSASPTPFRRGPSSR